jgi:seryl-tRNA(Sec) selenium transferase
MSKDGIKEINPRDLDTKGTNLQYRGAGRALRGQGKVINSVKPTLGKYKTKEYLMENQRKLAQAKVKLKAMQKVDKDVEAGYQSVIKKGKK